MEETKRLTERGLPRLEHMVMHDRTSPIPNPKYKNEALEARQIEHTIDMEDKKIEIEQEEKKQHWRSCCWDLHADSTRFFAKLFISTIVIGLCIYQLIMVEDCGSQHMYSGILGIILGAYLK
jgi:hypothetical protein